MHKAFKKLYDIEPIIFPPLRLSESIIEIETININDNFMHHDYSILNLSKKISHPIAEVASLSIFHLREIITTKIYFSRN